MSEQLFKIDRDQRLVNPFFCQRFLWPDEGGTNERTNERTTTTTTTKALGGFIDRPRKKKGGGTSNESTRGTTENRGRSPPASGMKRERDERGKEEG